METIDNVGQNNESESGKNTENVILKESKIRGRFRWLKTMIVIAVILFFSYLLVIF